jgi:hypothetical protein
MRNIAATCLFCPLLVLSTSAQADEFTIGGEIYRIFHRDTASNEEAVENPEYYYSATFHYDSTQPYDVYEQLPEQVNESPAFIITTNTTSVRWLSAVTDVEMTITDAAGNIVLVSHGDIGEARDAGGASNNYTVSSLYVKNTGATITPAPQRWSSFTYTDHDQIGDNTTRSDSTSLNLQNLFDVVTNFPQAPGEANLNPSIPSFTFSFSRYLSKPWTGGEEGISDYTLYQGNLTSVSGSDLDGDGVPDALDPYPDSDLQPAVRVGECLTEVENHFVADGTTMNDLVNALGEEPGSHGDFVSALAHLTNGWMKSGVISGKEKGRIMACNGG